METGKVLLRLFNETCIASMYPEKLLYIATMLGLAALGVWVLFTSRSLIAQALASYRWPTTDGIIVDSLDDSFTTMGIDRNNAGTVEVSNNETSHIYEYRVNGQTYRSSTYCFGAHAERAGAAYQVGSAVRVYYDPRHPERAVLSRGFQPSMIVGLALLGGAAYMGFELCYHWHNWQSLYSD